MTANHIGYRLPVSLIGYHLSFLLLGCLIRLAHRKVPYATRCLAAVGVVIAGTLPLVSGVGQGGNVNFSIATPTGAIMSIAAAVVVFIVSWSPRFSEQSALVKKLGAWSYSIYLFHEPIASVIGQVLHPDTAFNAISFLLLVSALTVAASAAIYRWIETPAIEAGRRLARSRPPASQHA